MSSTADRIADARAQLEAFGSEAQTYMDNLIARLQSEFDEFVTGIGGDTAQSPSLGGIAPGDLPGAGFGGGGAEALADNAGDSALNGALGRIAATSLKGLLTGKGTSSILDGSAASLEHLLGQSIGAGLTSSSAGFRLSGSQAASEQSSGLRAGERNS